MDVLIFYLLETHVVVRYETLCLTLGLACDHSLTFGFAYMIKTDVGLLGFFFFFAKLQN